MNINDIPSNPKDVATERDKAMAILANISPSTIALSSKSVTRYTAARYITNDADTQRMLTTAVMIATFKEPVLILGETGTGKELLAQIIHAPRVNAPLQSINCAGLPDSLFESLVFGSKRGSYTGSVNDEQGLLRAAGNGTAFLDEIGELPLQSQAKLLRTLETNSVRPIGDFQEYHINCRMVFATNRNLQSMVEAGTFRRDLYYRICTFTLHTKPLRDRPADAKLIADAHHKSRGWTDLVVDIPPQAYAKGNVRGLYCYLTRKELLGLEDNEALLGL